MIDAIDFKLVIFNDAGMLVDKELLNCGSAFDDIVMDSVSNFSLLLQFFFSVELDETVIFSAKLESVLF